MRIALVAPPFIPIPPIHYGGTELFIAQLAIGLKKRGVDVVVYANGESTVDVEVRSLYPKSQWPIDGEIYANLKDINHTAWAVRDAWSDCDILHVNNVPGLTFSRFAGPRVVYTLHHQHDERLSEFYAYYPDVCYVSISEYQQSGECMPHMRTIHHGVDLGMYEFQPRKQDYFAFLGRIAPMKGTHLAIKVAKATGIPLKIAGEVQPCFRHYFETEVEPHIDGRFIEYLGEADLAAKNELLGNAKAMLFPIQWNEPFGLVMIEAMATGTPVVALPGGAVQEVIRDGVSGLLCRSVDHMIARVRELENIAPEGVRAFVQKNFSVERMVDDYIDLYAEVIEQPSLIADSQGSRATA